MKGTNMETYNEMRARLVNTLSDWIDDCLTARFVDDSVVEDLVDEFIEEVGIWEKEHGVLKGISNPELFEDA